MGNTSYTEKVSVNVNTSALALIDLLVDNSYYSNRSDFITHAVRDALAKEQNTIDRIVQQKTENAPETTKAWFVGLRCIAYEELKKLQASHEKMSITGYGVLLFDRECSDDMILSTVDSISVRGSVKCSDAVRTHFGIIGNRNQLKST